MRQFFTYRFWLTLVALVALAAAAAAIASRSDGGATATSVSADRTSRRIDLVTGVADVVPAENFAMVGGRTTADLAVVIDATRTMRIVNGTPGEITCTEMAVPNSCVVAADLLGDGVLWFSIIDGASSVNLTLPAVREVMDDGWVLLANGWELRHAPRIDRVCDEDSTSLTDFIRQHGDTATSTYSVEGQEVVRVTCPRVTETTTTTIDPAATTTLFVDPNTPADPNAPPVTEEPG